MDTTQLAPSGRVNNSDYSHYSEYAIILRHKLQMTHSLGVPKVTTEVLLQSNYLIKAAEDVLKDVRIISWNTRPCKMDPFLPQFRTYLKDHSFEGTPDEEKLATEHLSFMIKFLEVEYDSTLRKVDALVSNDEITFDLLWAVLPPNAILFTVCQTTSEPRAVRLVNIHQVSGDDIVPFWCLNCEYVNGGLEGESVSKRFELANLELTIPKFEGAVKITNLKAYPLEWHPTGEEIRKKLVNRGRKWANLHGDHHPHYCGMAYRKESYAVNHFKVNVNGRIVIDRRAFAYLNPNYGRSLHRRNPVNYFRSSVDLDASMEQGKEPDEYILLTTPILYGFSLVDRRWLEFNVEHVSPIQWNRELISSLAIEPRRIALVRSLVEAHSENLIDDFVEGKGMGLVFNLFGPPGVGKSLTVEAISEHLQKPLYVVGAGDLGVDASSLDTTLSDIFYAAAKWKAVVLIDEADIFLEARGTADLQRNAMVAVFLRQIEYFRGILFLTTNRVTAFDPAFQSRIHLSLQYQDLSSSAKEQIWKAFHSKAQNSSLGAEDLTADQLRLLSEIDLNGRQIKNVVKVAMSLATDEKQPLSFSHFLSTLEVTGNYGL